MGKSGVTAWSCPANIAVVKYWGKKGVQLPVNPSISMSLSKCYTETTIEYRENKNTDGPTFIFQFDGMKYAPFESRINEFLKVAAREMNALKNLHLDITSVNSFPHSSGIASSASSFSSIAMCLCIINSEISGNVEDAKYSLQRASSLARLGSGSACRSVYGGWVLWGKTSGITGSSDTRAIPVNEFVHNNFLDYYDAILIISSGEKKISSSRGHMLMETSPWKRIRETTGRSNAIKILDALKRGNMTDFRVITEHEAFNLHAMFMVSDPHFILMDPGTLQVLKKIEEFRDETGIECCFTLDAGPNVHLLYPSSERTRILSFINTELIHYCENKRWIDDKIGNGPEPI